MKINSRAPKPSMNDIQELIKCSKDPIYWINNHFMYVDHRTGSTQLTLRDYQVNFINLLHNNSNVIASTCRQSGGTLTIAAYTLWCSIFHPNINTALLSMDARAADRISEIVMFAFSKLSSHMAPALKFHAKHSMYFDNGSKIFFGPVTKSCLRGLTLQNVFVDQFSLLQADVQDNFLQDVMPMRAYKNGKTLLMGTPNGKGNMFHTIWSVSGASIYSPWVDFEITYHDLPCTRDPWADLMRSMIGKDAFMQEYEGIFL